MEREDRRYLAELKSWGGSRSGQFDLDTVRPAFLENIRHGLFLLVDRLEGVPIAGKLLVVSSRSPEHDRPRRYRNGLGLVVPERGQVEPLRRAMRYLKAIERVRAKRQSLNLTTAQMQQLRDRERTEKAAFESAMRNLYQSVWLPVAGEGGLDIEKVTLAGRPLQAHGIHERLIELLTIVSPPRVFASVTPEKIVELMRLGEGDEPSQAIGTDQIVESFYSVPGFPRLENEAALRRAIARGVQQGTFGYVGRAGQAEVDQLREEGGYLVSPNAARIGADLSEGEVDLSSAFIVLPQGSCSKCWWCPGCLPLLRHYCTTVAV